MVQAAGNPGRSHPDVGQKALRQLRDCIVVGVAKFGQLLGDVRCHGGACNDFLQVEVVASLALMTSYVCSVT